MKAEKRQKRDNPLPGTFVERPALGLAQAPPPIMGEETGVSGIPGIKSSPGAKVKKGRPERRYTTAIGYGTMHLHLIYGYCICSKLGSQTNLTCSKECRP